MVNLNEFNKLVAYLEEHDIEHEVTPIHGGMMVCVPNKSNRLWDAVCHSFSYGHKYGLLEIYGSLVSNEGDSVEGYLTSDTVIERIKECEK